MITTTLKLLKIDSHSTADLFFNYLNYPKWWMDHFIPDFESMRKKNKGIIILAQENYENIIGCIYVEMYPNHLNLDPRLESGVDYLSLLVSMLIANLLGALWSVITLIYIFGTITWIDAADYFFAWFGGNMLAGVVFNFVLLKALSQWIVNARMLVKEWWA